MLPDSSPAEIIRVTIDGNWPHSSNGTDRRTPSFTFRIVSFTTSINTVLPVTRAEVWRPESIGTPAETIAPKVRVSRDTAILRLSGPSSGILSLIRSHIRRPFSVLAQLFTSFTNTKTPAATRYQYPRMIL